MTNTAPATCWGGVCHLVSFLGQEEILDILVFDTISAHIQFLHGYNVFREFVLDSAIGIIIFFVCSNLLYIIEHRKFIDLC